jgi:hypothetical protein
MIINWHEYKGKDHVLAWFITHALGSIKNWSQLDGFEASKLNVELKINGVEVPIVAPMEFLQGKLELIEKNGYAKGMQEALDIVRDTAEEAAEKIREETLREKRN